MKSRFYAYNFGIPLLCAALVFLMFGPVAWLGLAAYALQMNPHSITMAPDPSSSLSARPTSIIFASVPSPDAVSATLMLSGRSLVRRSVRPICLR